MPTLAQRWEEKGIERGIEKGHLLEKQNVLIMLLSTHFHLTKDDHQFIKSMKNTDKLDSALKLVLTASSKEKVLDFLKNADY